MKLVVNIPAYNEEETVAEVVAEIPRKINGIDTVEILLIDDGSTDGTVEKAREAGVDRVVSHIKNRGLGVTFKDGLDGALEMGADIIVNIDGDGQYNATEIGMLIQPILNKEADIVIGWRDINNLAFMPIGKKIGNKIATRVTRFVSGLPIIDAQSGYRAFSREAALRMNLSGQYTYVQETIIEAKYKGLKIVQVPIEFRPREGKSRLIPNLTTYASRAGATIFGTYARYHSSKILSSIGVLFIVFGVILSVLTLYDFVQDGTISGHVPTAVFSMLLLVTGLQTMVFAFFANVLTSQRQLQDEILYRLKKQPNTHQKEH